MKEYNRSLLEVSLRMLVFIIYYAAMILLGILMIVTTVVGTLVILPLLISGASGITGVLILNLVTGVVFGLNVMMFAICLIKPLFLFTRSDAANQAIEVSRDDCFMLFAVIKNATSFVGTRMPKHVYVSEGVDARIFYETNFWSIFFPVRKNLKIGLELLDKLNVLELKAIVGQKFSHFSKEGKKFESTVYVINQVLYNLATAKDSYDKWVDKWCHSSNPLFIFIGFSIQLFSRNIHKLNVIMYMFVYRSYQKLAKQMEYDADIVSCHYMGSDIFVSAMKQVGIKAKNKRLYQEVFDMLAAEKKVPEDIYEAMLKIGMHLSINDYIEMRDYDPLSSKQDIDHVESRINIENTWGFHSDTKERLRRAAALNIQVPHPRTIRAWQIIPEELYKKVSDLVINRMNEEGEMKTISEFDFEEWAQDHLEEILIKDKMVKPYFGRDIMPFTFNEGEMMPKESPFNDHNRHIIAEFLTARRDWETLQKLQSGEINVEYITYNGKITTIKNLPMEEHRKYYEKLANQVSYIDKWVVSFLTDHPKKSKYKKEVDFYLNLARRSGAVLNDSLIPLYNHKNFFEQRVFACHERIMGRKQARQEFIKYKEAFYQAISHVDLQFVASRAGEEYANSLKRLINNWEEDTLDMQSFYRCRLDTIPKDLVRMHKKISNKAKSKLGYLTRNTVDRNTVKGDDKEMNFDDSKMVGNISIQKPYVAKNLFRFFDIWISIDFIFLVLSVLYFFIIIFFP